MRLPLVPARPNGALMVEKPETAKIASRARGTSLAEHYARIRHHVMVVSQRRIVGGSDDPLPPTMWSPASPHDGYRFVPVPPLFAEMHRPKSAEVGGFLLYAEISHLPRDRVDDEYQH